MEADFGGYATKAGVVCSDGKTIAPTAFMHMDKLQVPLVYNHNHDNPGNVLGHAILEARTDGVYARGYFNDTTNGLDAKKFVKHKDVRAMSIYANGLSMNGSTVTHGQIREVSLVLAGANPDAKIDHIQHADGFGDMVEAEDAAIIMNGFNIDEDSLVHADTPAAPDKKNPDGSDDDTAGPDAEDGKGDKESLQDIYDTLSSKQKDLVANLIEAAVSSDEGEPGPDDAAPDTAKHSDDTGDPAATPDTTTAATPDTTEGTSLTHKEGTGIVPNLFETASATKPAGSEVVRHVIPENDLKELYRVAKQSGSLAHAMKDYALAHSIENIEALFPPAQLVGAPEFLSRNMAWVQNVLDSTRKTPFANVKSVVADITLDEARAKGYVTGAFKKEELFKLVSRVTTPTTIYKKQKLNRDDVLDIVDIDVIPWLKSEMRVMLSEETAVAILLGDGREIDDPDKVMDPSGSDSGPGLRSVYNDDELYVTRVNVNVDDANSNYSEVVDAIMSASEFYLGTGGPTFYAAKNVINKLLLSKDANLRRMYDNLAALAAGLGVDNIVAVEPMKRFPDLLGIIVNLTDYNIGTNRGGEVNMFDFFDIDYNQMKYLMETRVSGALVKPKSALVIMKTAVNNVLVAPTKPDFVTTTGVITIPTQTGVVYKNGTITLSSGAQTALTAGTAMKVTAVPASGYFFAVTGQNLVDEWTFERPSA